MGEWGRASGEKSSMRSRRRGDKVSLSLLPSLFSFPLFTAFLFSLLTTALSLEAGELQQASEKPLPELNSFLQGVRKKLHSDRLLLSQYTYNEKVTVERLDKNGKVKETEVRVYEVYPSLEKRRTYRR